MQKYRRFLQTVLIGLLVCAMAAGVTLVAGATPATYAKVYAAAGNYPYEVVKGDALISAPGVTLNDVYIKGDLYVKAGLGTVTLNGVRISGRTITLKDDDTAAVMIGGSSSVSEKNYSPYTKDYIYGDQILFSPALSKRGSYGAGTRTFTVTYEDKYQAGVNRELLLEMWYPAEIPAGVEQLCTYTTDSVRPRFPGESQVMQTVPVEFTGRALRDAAFASPEAPDTRFPVIVYSHGWPGTSSQLSYLAENLASKGYVFVAINHPDSNRALNQSQLNPSFATLESVRPQDVEKVVGTMWAYVQENEFGMNGKVAQDNFGLMGYSMGAVGTLNAAGVGFRSTGAATQPADRVYGNAAYNSRVITPVGKIQTYADLDPNTIIKCVVLAGPYGTAANSFFGDNDAVAALTKPTFVIVGSKDNVANADSIKDFVKNKMTSAERYLLVYNNGRHNVITNPPPLEAVLPGMDASANSGQVEYMWDFMRLAVNNEHFVTAFLNKYLKGDNTMNTYMQGLKQKPRQKVSGSDTWMGFSVAETNAHGASNTQNMALGMEFYYGAAGGPIIEE